MNLLIKKTNPYINFFKLMGGKPQILLHGDNLDGTSTWSGKYGSINGSINGTVSVNNSGWSANGVNLKTLTLSSANSNRIDLNSEASNYVAGTSFTWVWAQTLPTSAAARNVIFLGSSSNSNNWRGFQVNPSDIALVSSNRNGSSQSTSDIVAATEGVKIIFGLSLQGPPASQIANCVQLISTGHTTLLNSTSITMTGTLNVDRFSFGALCVNNSYSGYFNGEVRFLACLRGTARSVTQLQNITSYVSKKLRCPL